jgi:dienelactone hydrolase
VVYEEIDGIKTYVATPKVEYPNDKAIIYFTDIFSLELPDTSSLTGLSLSPDQILLTSPINFPADYLALKGSKVYAPELFQVIPSRLMFSPLAAPYA